jgi:hypothetical protein
MPFYVIYIIEISKAESCGVEGQSLNNSEHDY